LLVVDVVEKSMRAHLLPDGVRSDGSQSAATWIFTMGTASRSWDGGGISASGMADAVWLLGNTYGSSGLFRPFRAGAAGFCAARRRQRHHVSDLCQNDPLADYRIYRIILAPTWVHFDDSANCALATKLVAEYQAAAWVAS